MGKNDSYSKQMDTLQTESLYWVEMANAEFEANGHTKQECVYIQKAIDARDKMMRISTGAEREYQAKRKAELGRQLNEVIMIIDPDYFRRRQQASGGSGSGTGGNGTGRSSGSRPASSSERTVPQEEVDSWKKPVPPQKLADVNGMEELKKKVAPYAEQEEDVLSYALFEQVAVKFFEYRKRQKYGLDSNADPELGLHSV